MEDFKVDLIEAMENRAFGYTFFKNFFFVEPDFAYIRGLREGDYFKGFPYGEKNKELASTLDKLKEELDRIKEVDLGDLKWDYTRMFVGPGDLTAPPWESSYVNEDKLLFQEETLQVRRSYLKYNYLSSNYPHEAEDHIALELDFMAKLSIKAMDDLEKGDLDSFLAIAVDQRYFLEEHLNKWVFEFIDKVESTSQSKYFKIIGRLLGLFIKEDYDFNLEILKKLSKS